MARKITLETSVFLKINTGNFESIDVSKTVREEVEFDTPAELIEKSKKLDNMAQTLLKAEAEAMMEQLGRRRIMSIGGTATPVNLWESYVNEPKMVKVGSA